MEGLAKPLWRHEVTVAGKTLVFEAGLLEDGSLIVRRPTDDGSALVVDVLEKVKE